MLLATRAVTLFACFAGAGAASHRLRSAIDGEVYSALLADSALTDKRTLSGIGAFCNQIKRVFDSSLCKLLQWSVPELAGSFCDVDGALAAAQIAMQTRPARVAFEQEHAQRSADSAHASTDKSQPEVAMTSEQRRNFKTSLAALGAGHEHGSSDATSLAAFRQYIAGSDIFKSQVSKLSDAMGCSSVPKASECEKYAEDVAFCMAFAVQRQHLLSEKWVGEQAKACQSIDGKLPALS
mmetsp:Transcript_57684/g.101002  ORF Transcript_57684/g.101002 Transcript_57684/m.101002 type:complete len:238 (+) Transcript_57684:92-805(+)